MGQACHIHTTQYTQASPGRTKKPYSQLHIITALHICPYLFATFNYSSDELLFPSLIFCLRHICEV